MPGIEAAIPGAHRHHEPATIVVIGIGNSLRGDDGIGPWLVEQALPRWLSGSERAGVELRSCRQLLPELALELPGVRHLLLVDAWAAGAGADRAPWLGPLDGRAAARAAPPPAPGWGIEGTPIGGAPSWCVGHRLQPRELLALASALGVELPHTDGLLVPGWSWQPPQGPNSGPFSAPLMRLLPRVRRLLLAWLRQVQGDAAEFF